MSMSQRSRYVACTAIIVLLGGAAVGGFYAGKATSKPDISVSTSDFSIDLTLTDKDLFETYGGIGEVRILLEKHGWEIRGDLRVPDLKRNFNGIDSRALEQKSRILEDYIRGNTIHPNVYRGSPGNPI